MRFLSSAGSRMKGSSLWKPPWFGLPFLVPWLLSPQEYCIELLFYSAVSVAFLIIWVLIHTISMVCSACKIYFEQLLKLYSLNIYLGLSFLSNFKHCFHDRLFQKPHVASWEFQKRTWEIWTNLKNASWYCSFFA